MNTDSFNNNFKLDEDFRVCPTDVILSEPEVEPILDEVNNYTILLREMNKESVELPNDECDARRSICDEFEDTNVTDDVENVSEKCTTDEWTGSEVNEDQDSSVTAVPDNNNSDVYKISGSEDRKFVTCSVCNVKLLRKSYRRHFVNQHVSKQVKKCPYCQKFFTSSNLRRHMRTSHNSSSESNNKREVGQKVCVNVEQIKINKLKIKPEDPVKERERLTLVKGAGISYKVLDSTNSNNDCKICHQSFGFNKYSLLRHYSVAHFKDEMLKYVVGDSLKCKFCGLLCADLDLLVGHIGSNHHKIEEYLRDDGEDTESMKCTKSSSTESPDNLECGHCQQKFRFRSSLYQHYSRTHFEMEMRTFIDKESDICKFCGILIRKPIQMIAHIGSVHDKVEDFLPDQWKIEKKNMAPSEEIFEGDKMPVESKKKEENFQSQKIAFQCRICPSKTTDYGRRSGLLSHYSTCHYQEELAKFIDTKSKSCLICGKKADKWKLLAHVGCAHKKLEEFLPEEYKLEKSKSSNNISHHRNSILQHLKKKPRTSITINGPRCKMCSKFGFSSKGKLDRHYACVHFKDKLLPFVDVESLTCLICEKKLSGLGGLLLHVGSYHGKLDGLLPEEDCHTNKSKIEDKIKMKVCHSTDEKNEDEFLCPFCEDNCYFDSQRDLYRHYSIVHYQTELQDYVGTNNSCPLCQDKRSRRNIIIHLGVHHNLVEQFIPEKIPVLGDVAESNKKVTATNNSNNETENSINDLEEVDTESDLLTILKVEESAVTLKEKVVKDSDISDSTIYESDDLNQIQNNNSSKDSLLDDIRNIFDSDDSN